MAFDTIELSDATRRGEGRAERQHREYVVNGRKLSRLFPPLDLLSAFGWLDRRSESEFARVLLLKRPSSLASGRVPLYVCPQCADLGCGAVTVSVARYDDRYAWKEFGREDSLGGGLLATLADGYEFHFAREAYESVFRPLT